jgi:hypothetical protein
MTSREAPNETLTANEITKALARIGAWRLDPEQPVACPRCDVARLTIIDRSARPYAEWYVMSCAACGLQATLNIPLPGPGLA